MLLVIFGAGASYDSDPAHPANPGFLHAHNANRPPLANDLFQDRESFVTSLDEFPACHAIVPTLRKASADVEAELERLRQEADQYPERHQQLAAVRWYLQRMLSRCDIRWYQECRRITSYLTLLDQIRLRQNKDVLLVTFNYDRLLDWAIEDFTKNNLGDAHVFNKVGAYVDGPFPLIKLHGSVHWGQVIEQPATDSLAVPDQAISKAIAKAGSIVLSDEFVVCGTQRKEMTVCGDRGRMLFPALAIPMRTKLDFACPGDHLTFLKEKLPSVRRVLIIGWRGMDKHFVDLLAEGLPPNARSCIVVGSHQAGVGVWEKLRGEGVKGECQAYSGGFSHFVTDPQNAAILQRPHEPMRITPIATP